MPERMSNEEKLNLFNYEINKDGYFIRVPGSAMGKIAQLTLGFISQEKWDSAETFNICFQCQKFADMECEKSMDANLCERYVARVLNKMEIEEIKAKVTGK